METENNHEEVAVTELKTRHLSTCGYLMINCFASGRITFTQVQQSIAHTYRHAYAHVHERRQLAVLVQKLFPCLFRGSH